MGVAERGDVDGATVTDLRRLRAEEAMVDRILGLPAGSIQVMGSEDYIRSMIVGWVGAPGFGAS